MYDVIDRIRPFLSPINKKINQKIYLLYIRWKAPKFCKMGLRMKILLTLQVNQTQGTSICLGQSIQTEHVTDNPI